MAEKVIIVLNCCTTVESDFPFLALIQDVFIYTHLKLYACILILVNMSRIVTANQPFEPSVPSSIQSINGLLDLASALTQNQCSCAMVKPL